MGFGPWENAMARFKLRFCKPLGKLASELLARFRCICTKMYQIFREIFCVLSFQSLDYQLGFPVNMIWNKQSFS
jgi:hypothetical protein